MKMDRIDLNNLDKSTWTTYRFDQIASSISERVDPTNTDLKHYIGLEHIDSENIHITRMGAPAEVSGQKLRCYPGDVIFGRRRAYQRKAAVCEVDGFCSAHSLVLRANPDIIDPKLFPFFLHSDTFMHRAVDISVGSLSPTINWKTLRKQELLLPPKEQQPQLVELFLGIDKVIENQVLLLEKAKQHFVAQKEQWVLQGLGNKSIFSPSLKKNIAEGWLDTTVGELINTGYINDVQDGNHGGIHPKTSDYVVDGIPFIMANTLIDGEISFAATKKIPQEKTDRLRIGFSKPGDVLISHKGTVGEVAIVPEKLEWPYLMLTPQVTYYRVNSEKLDREFLYFVFTSNFFQKQLLRFSSGQSTRAYVGITAQKNIKIAIPKNIEIQKEITLCLQKMNLNIKGIRRTISTSKILQKSLINQVF